MYSENPYFARELSHPLGDQGDYHMQNSHTAPALNGFFPCAIDPPIPFRKVDIQPSDACPRNFLIFDQTRKRSQIMFHPEINSNLFNPGLDVNSSPIFLPDINQVHPSDEGKLSSSFKENSDDINALLSTEYEEDGECDDEEGEEVSTARTNAMHESDSSDSCSNYKSSPSRMRCSLFRKSSVSRSNKKKRQRVRKMVKALRGIVPDTNRMSTVAVLDEAVRYLKFLRVEVQKLGVENTQV